MKNRITVAGATVRLAATALLLGVHQLAAEVAGRSRAVRASGERGDNNSSSNIGWILLVLAILAIATPVLIAWFNGKLDTATSQ